MKGQNGIQMQVHPKFQEICKDIKDERIKMGKERNGDLSFKRLSLCFYRILKQRPDFLKILVNAEIDLNEVQ